MVEKLRIARYDEFGQCWVILTPDGHIFAECPETVYSEGRERAKRLVNSVNNHERLVEALHGALETLEVVDPRHPERERINALLTELEQDQ